MLLALFSAAFLAGCAVGGLAVVVIGIHAAERRSQTRGSQPVTHAERAARRVLGGYVHNPETGHIADHGERTR
jgi:hypothetical protein